MDSIRFDDRRQERRNRFWRRVRTDADAILSSGPTRDAGQPITGGGRGHHFDHFAGGAFGAMLRQAGIADAVGELASGVPGLMLLPVAFVVTASIRTLQGSATVAMITAAGVLQGFAQLESLAFHPVYLAVAIGAGSKPISWMTDSGFWIITEMSGMTEIEGLKTMSVLTTVMGFAALGITMLCAWILPGV